MRKLHVAQLVPICLCVICAACTARNTRELFTVQDIQGVWWVSCAQPAADFVVQGSKMTGDFEEEFETKIVNGDLVVDDGHGPVSFWHLVKASPSQLIFRSTTEEAPDWVLRKCVQAPGNAP